GDKGDYRIANLGGLRLYLIEPATRSESEPFVCAYPDDLGAIPEMQFLRARGLDERSRFVRDNIRVIRTLIQSHQAIGVLPEYLCGPLLADRRPRATPRPRHPPA